MGYIYIILTVFFTTYGQLILKWRMNKKTDIPDEWIGKVKYLFSLYSDIWIISGFISALLASITWMMAIKYFELSKAYPFMALNFILVLFFSYLFFNEQINFYKICGVFLIAIGVFLISK